MKQYQINNAYGVLKRLSACEMPVREAYAVYMLMKKMEPMYKFEIERERQLVAKYGAVGNDGKILFRDQESAAKFSDELREMGEMDIEFQNDPVVIRMDLLSGQSFTPADIAHLDGFITLEA